MVKNFLFYHRCLIVFECERECECECMSQLPRSLDPIKLAKQNAQLQGQLLLRELPRIQDIFDQADQQAQIDLQFGQDNKRFYFMEGKIKATLNLICQRCTHSMHFDLDSSFLLSPVTSDERAKNLPAKYEPVFMQDELIFVYEMIEDEILLALPMVAKHGKCELSA